MQGSSHNSPVKLIRSTLGAEASWLLWLPTEPHPASPPSQPSHLTFGQLHLLGEQSPAVLPDGKVIREESFPVRLLRHWHELGREAVAAPYPWKCSRKGWMRLGVTPS